MVFEELAYFTGEVQAAASAGVWATVAVTPVARMPVSPTAHARRARWERYGMVIVDLLCGPAWSGPVDDMCGSQGHAVLPAFADPRGEHEQHGDHHEDDAGDAEPVDRHGGDERVVPHRGGSADGHGAVHAGRRQRHVR